MVIGISVFILWYLFSQKFSKLKYTSESLDHPSPQIITVNIPTFIYRHLLKKVLITVGTGLLLLLIILLISSRFKIILIILPLCFYLMGQFFIFQNHINIIKRQKSFYNRLTNILTVTDISGKEKKFELKNNNIKIKEIKPLQKNNGLSLGYFELRSNKEKCYVSHLLLSNERTHALFIAIEKLSKETETKAFPLI